VGLAMLIRFVIPRRDTVSHVEQGIFQAAHELCSQGCLADEDWQHVQDLFRWFNDHLPVPSRFSRSRRPQACKRAISWFKPTARECLKRLEALAAVLRRHGCAVERLTTERPGYVVYEDHDQVVAEVFRGEYRR
jgi:hypothetical protein